jgi:hypothetical protein
MMDERIQKAFDFASESCKQLITLSTGILALTITFTKDLAGDLSSGEETLLTWAWVAYLVSVLFGVWTLHALTGSLASPKDPIPNQKTFELNTRLPSGVQIVTFIAGLVLTVIFGIRTV